MEEKTKKEEKSSSKKEESVKKKKLLTTASIFVILVILGFGFQFAVDVYQSKSQDVLKFGFVTDAHSYSKTIKNKKKEILGYEVNWRALNPMNVFAERMNEKFHPDFVIENGDYIKSSERAKEEFLELEEIFSQINSPRYHVLGNHEVRDAKKQDWLNWVGYEKPYYFFDVKNYRMIVLDGNFFPVCHENTPTVADSVCLEQGKEVNVLDVIDSEPNVEYYPGYVNQEQMEWLEDTLKSAKDKKLLVFIHQPPIPASEVKDAGVFVFNKEELRGVFEKYGVVAVFSGHIEELCHQEINGVKYFVIPGFYKENQLIEEEEQYFSVFSEVRLRGDDVDVKMFYKTKEDMKEGKYKSMMVDQSKSYCGKKVFDEISEK